MPNIPIGQIGTPVWSFLASQAGGTVLFVNVDQNDTITLGNDAGVAPGDSSAPVILPPQGSVSLAANENWFAVTDANDNPLLMVVPGGTQWSPTQVGIDTATIAAMALEIATQLAQSGISLLASPTLLYGGQAPRTGAGLVGVSLIKYKGIATGGTPNPSLAQVQQVEGDWNTSISRPMGANCSKRYFGPPDANNPLGEMPTSGTTSQNIANIAASGCKVLVSLKPFPDTTGGYTTGPNAAKCAQAFTQLVNCIAYITSLATNGVEYTLWQEPNLDASNWGGTDDVSGGIGYAKYVAFYGPAFKTPNQTVSQTLVFDPVTSGAAGSIAAYWHSGSYNSLIDKLVCDAYCLDYTKGSGNNGQRFIGELNSIQSIANGVNKPFGFWEWGVTDGAATVPLNSAQAIAAGKPANLNFQFWNENYIIGTMVGRLNGGLQNADTVWYVSGTGQNDPDVDTTGIIVSEIQKTFDALSSAPSSLINIAAGATATLPANNPSPGAGYAIADGMSYDITINLVTSTGSTKPFVIATLNWFNDDIPNAQPVATQSWALACGKTGTAGTYTLGKGPQRGQFLQITLQNQDTVVVGANCQVNGTSRTVAKDDWVWDVSSSVNVPAPSSLGGITFALADGGSYVNSLGSVNSASIPAAGGQKAFMFGLFTGQAFIRISGEGSGFLNYVFNPFPQAFFGSAAVINQSPTTEFGEMILCPRGPMIVTITNNDPGAAHNANIEIITLD